MHGDIDETYDDTNSLLYDERQVTNLLRISRATLHRYCKKGLFPKFFYLHPETKSGKRWFAKDIHEYIRARAMEAGVVQKEKATCGENDNAI